MGLHTQPIARADEHRRVGRCMYAKNPNHRHIALRVLLLGRILHTCICLPVCVLLACMMPGIRLAKCTRFGAQPIARADERRRPGGCTCANATLRTSPAGVFSFHFPCSWMTSASSSTLHISAAVWDIDGTLDINVHYKATATVYKAHTAAHISQIWRHIGYMSRP